MCTERFEPDFNSTFHHALFAPRDPAGCWHSAGSELRSGAQPACSEGGRLLCSKSPLFKWNRCFCLGDVNIKQLCRTPRSEHLRTELALNLSIAFSLVLPHMCSTYL